MGCDSVRWPRRTVSSVSLKAFFSSIRFSPVG